MHWCRNSHNLIVVALKSLVVVHLILRDNPQHDLGFCGNIIGNTGLIVGTTAVDRLLQTHDVEVREALTPKLYTTLEPYSFLHAFCRRSIAGVVGITIRADKVLKSSPPHASKARRRRWSHCHTYSGMHRTSRSDKALSTKRRDDRRPCWCC